MQYLEFYEAYVEFTEAPKDGDEFTACKCPIHEDKRASAGVNLLHGTFNCFKCGSMSPERFLTKLTSMSFPEACSIVDEFRRNASLIIRLNTFVNTRVTNPKWDTLWQKSKEEDLTQLEMARDYAESRGLTIETLIESGVGYLPKEYTHWKCESLVFPYVVDGRCVGIRYRSPNGSKSGEPGCHFTLWNLDRVTEDTEYAVVLEGESDGLRAFQAVKKVLPNVAVLSTPTGMFSPAWAREFETCHKVIIIPQADEAAEKMVTNAKKVLGDKFDYIELPWRRRQYGKDLCEWLRYNEETELIERIQEKLGNTERRFWSGAEFQQVADKPRDYVVGNLIARSEIAMIAGPPKNKKTWFALGMAASVLTGESLMGIDHFGGHAKGKVMIVEEEGDAPSLYERAEMVFGNIDGWQENTLWGHHLGVRLDEEGWMKKLEIEIEKFQPDLLILDPLQRMHNKDENSASEMGEVWFNLHRLTRKFSRIAITLLHHFNKEGDITLGWNAMRGSSRNAGEADLGIFVQKFVSTGTDGCKVYIDGRNYRHVETPAGGDIWTFNLEENGLRYSSETPDVVMGKKVGVLRTLFEKSMMTLPELCKHLGMQPQALRKVIASKGWDKFIKSESIGQGKPVTLTWIGGSWEDVTAAAEKGDIKL